MRRNGLTFETGATQHGPSPKVPHATLVFAPADRKNPAAVPPDGAVQMRWTDATGFENRVEVVQWWRLDRQGLEPGVEVCVDVQARQQRSVAFPPHQISATLVVTGDCEDLAQVLIGDPWRENTWFYGVEFYGALLVKTAVLVEEVPGAVGSR